MTLFFKEWSQKNNIFQVFLKKGDSKFVGYMETWN